MKRRGFLQGVAAAIAFVAASASAFGSVAANVCSKLALPKRRMILPPVPKWNSLTDDIDRLDYKKRSEDFERSFLPNNLVFPCEGQVWEVVRDCKVWRRQAQGNRMFSNEVSLHKGERVRILPLDHPKPLQIWFQSLSSDEPNSQFTMRMARTVPGQGEQPAYFSDCFRLCVV